MGVQEEGRLIQERDESAHKVTCDKNKKPTVKKKGKNKTPTYIEKKEEGMYFFCRNKGVMRKDYSKRKAWLERKGDLTSLVCHKSNMVDVSYNTLVDWLVQQSMFLIPYMVS